MVDRYCTTTLYHFEWHRMSEIHLSSHNETLFLPFLHLKRTILCASLISYGNTFPLLCKSLFWFTFYPAAFGTLNFLSSFPNVCSFRSAPALSHTVSAWCVAHLLKGVGRTYCLPFRSLVLLNSLKLGSDSLGMDTPMCKVGTILFPGKEALDIYWLSGHNCKVVSAIMMNLFNSYQKQKFCFSLGLESLSFPPLPFINFFLEGALKARLLQEATPWLFHFMPFLYNIYLIFLL